MIIPTAGIIATICYNQNRIVEEQRKKQKQEEDNKKRRKQNVSREKSK